MIKLNCKKCGKIFMTYPCRLKGNYGHKAKYCSKHCANQYNQNGKETRFKKGHIPSTNRIMPSGNDHPLWKGDGVGYRGLHYWLRRIKGQPLKCLHCGYVHQKTRDMDWANIDHQYLRNSNDYIPLCKSCHKIYDLKSNPVPILRF
jgi:hypothetical protein